MNPDTLMAAMPGLDRARANAYVEPNNRAMREFSITNTMRAWMWLAQVGHESASLRYFEEIADGSAYEGRPDLGNTQPGDGRRFKGRGPIQITGRANYTAAARALGLDLVGNPGLAAQPVHAFRVSAWWWSAHGLNGISDTGDVTAATRRINGGLNGLADRQARYARVRNLGPNAVLPGPAQPTFVEGKMIESVVASKLTYVFSVNANRDMIGVTWQGGDNKWAGAGRGGSGYMAGFQPFCKAPAGRKIASIAALVAANGALHLWARADDGTVWVTWQHPNGDWQGKGGGYHAALQHFATNP